MKIANILIYDRKDVSICDLKIHKKHITFFKSINSEHLHEETKPIPKGLLPLQFIVSKQNLHWVLLKYLATLDIF